MNLSDESQQRAIFIFRVVPSAPATPAAAAESSKN
jgi:hypothetical protein